MLSQWCRGFPVLCSSSANLNSRRCFKAFHLAKLTKRSPQVRVKSSSVSSELQSINTAGRAFSQDGRGATGCSSKGTQIKRHNLYYYSLPRRRELCLCRQTTAVKEPRLCCHSSAYNPEISADDSPQRSAALSMFLLEHSKSWGRCDPSHGYN